jgi:hypothetical protein
VEPNRVHVLVFDDNPLVRRLLRARAERRIDVLLETFETPVALFARLGELGTVDLVVFDGELEGSRLSPKTEVFIGELTQQRHSVLLVLDHVTPATARPGVVRGTRPMSIEEIAMIAQRQRKHRSGMRLHAVDAIDDEKSKNE